MCPICHWPQSRASLDALVAGDGDVVTGDEAAAAGRCLRLGQAVVGGAGGSAIDGGGLGRHGDAGAAGAVPAALQHQRRLGAPLRDVL